MIHQEAATKFHGERVILLGSNRTVQEHLVGNAVIDCDPPDGHASTLDVAAESHRGHPDHRTVFRMTAFAERYEIQDRLGEGGNGVVFLVRDTKIGRDLALKLLSVGEESLVVREAHALTALESPHVLRVFNAGVHLDVPFIATDVAALGSTEDQIVSGVGVPPEHAVRWVRQALVGLDYCHRRRVLHRDLTPGNIFLNTLDHALLGDFGLAANIDDDGTSPAAGNQRCRAPEGFDGGRLTVQSDLFSAAASLWRLLTSAWPYDAEHEADLATKMRNSERPRLRDIAPHVHRSITTVVERALDPNPSRRPTSASEMARLLADARLHSRNWVRRAPGPSADLMFTSEAGGSGIVVCQRPGECPRVWPSAVLAGGREKSSRQAAPLRCRSR
ncbi:MAG: serine/threonine-protein kinase [Actinomycetota bacterium]